MTLVQLRYAAALERAKNFALAASELLIAQPTLSLQIQKLERDLGILIFDRSTNPISVTPEGKDFLEQARIVLQEADKLEYMFSQKDESVAGELRLGIIPTVASSLLIKILPLINKKYPDLNLKIFELPTDQIIQRLEAGSMDLGILATPLRSRKIKEIPLYYEPFRVYIPPSLKLRSKTVSTEDLERYEMIVLGEEHCFRAQTLKVCRNSASGRIEAGSFETVKKLVDHNLGITLLPYFEEVSDGSRIRNLSDPKPPAREISIAVSQSFYKFNALKALKKEIIGLIPEEFHSPKEFHIIGID